MSKARTLLVISTLVVTSSISQFSAHATGLLKLTVTKQHSYLNGYKPGEKAFLGDEWTLKVKATDEDGDPAAGAIARIYRGSKTLSSARISSKGIAVLTLPITKIGQNSLKVIVTDDDPKNRGESSLNFIVVNPDVLTNPVLNILAKDFYLNTSDPSISILTLNVPKLQSEGCIKYWMIFPDFEVTWPFSESDVMSMTGNMSIPNGDQSKLDSILQPMYKGWRFIQDPLEVLICLKVNGNLAIFQNN
jgi:hypothetical protein